MKNLENREKGKTREMGNVEYLSLASATNNWRGWSLRLVLLAVDLTRKFQVDTALKNEMNGDKKKKKIVVQINIEI